MPHSLTDLQAFAAEWKKIADRSPCKVTILHAEKRYMMYKQQIEAYD
jgi:tRNA-dihydrouridine synthase